MGERSFSPKTNETCWQPNFFFNFSSVEKCFFVDWYLTTKGYFWEKNPRRCLCNVRFCGFN